MLNVLWTRAILNIQYKLSTKLRDLKGLQFKNKNVSKGGIF
jgi:c-di-GMP-binding flagellar brake protein YcgR